MGEHGANRKLQEDWSYIWKVPRCKAPPAPSPDTVVITRDDKAISHDCSSHNGFVYVDAKPLDSESTNPLRFVNGVAAPRDMDQAGQARDSNVDAFFADDRVWYYTSRPVQLGEELVVDYGPAYWEQRHEIDENQPGGKQDEMDMDWSNFQSDD
jgi:SET domain-containing protein